MTNKGNVTDITTAKPEWIDNEKHNGGYYFDFAKPGMYNKMTMVVDLTGAKYHPGLPTASHSSNAYQFIGFKQSLNGDLGYNTECGVRVMMINGSPTLYPYTNTWDKSTGEVVNTAYSEALDTPARNADGSYSFHVKLRLEVTMKNGSLTYQIFNAATGESLFSKPINNIWVDSTKQATWFYAVSCVPFPKQENVVPDLRNGAYMKTVRISDVKIYSGSTLKINGIYGTNNALYTYIYDTDCCEQSYSSGRETIDVTYARP